MPAIVLKSTSTLLETRREILRTVSWQISSNLWSPPTDQYETEDAYVVRVEVAGMQEDEFQVSVENNALLISGSRPDFHEQRAYQQMEIRFGKFATSVRLLGPVKIAEASAKYKDGFLTVILPKATTDQNEVK